MNRGVSGAESIEPFGVHAGNYRVLNKVPQLPHRRRGVFREVHTDPVELFLVRNAATMEEQKPRSKE